MIELKLGEQIKFVEPTMIQIGNVQYINVLKVAFHDKDPITKKHEAVVYGLRIGVMAFHYTDRDYVDIDLIFCEDGSGGLVTDEIEFIVQEIPENRRRKSFLDEANERFNEL